MDYEVTMPKLSDSMESGTIIEWKKSVGDKVDEGDVLVEIESDKAVMELENFRAGYLVDIRKQDGEEATVGDVIAVIGKEAPAEGEGKAKEKDGGASKEKSNKQDEADKPQAEAKQAEEKPDTKKAQAEEKAEEPAKEAKAENKDDIKAKGGGEEKAKKQTKEAATQEMETYPAGKEKQSGKKEASKKEEKSAGFSVPPPARGGIAVSPYAKHLAMLRGVDISDITGTGPGGRITAKDIEGTPAGEPAEGADKARGKAVEPSGAVEKSKKPGQIDVPDSLPEIKPAEGEADIERPSNYYLSMVAHVTAAKHHIPHFYVQGAADVGALMKAKASIPKDKHITVGHLVTKAVVDAIKAVPEVNRSYDRERLIVWKRINIGLAVATDKGLASVVVRDAGTMNYAELARATDEVVERARAGKLKSADRGGATFTVSNLGMYNIESFTAIIDPPASSILAVARAQDAPIVKNGALTFSKTMRLVLSCDHRAVDGVAGAKFMDALVEILEDPKRLGVEG